MGELGVKGVTHEGGEAAAIHRVGLLQWLLRLFGVESESLGMVLSKTARWAAEYVGRGVAAGLALVVGEGVVGGGGVVVVVVVVGVVGVVEGEIVGELEVVVVVVVVVVGDLGTWFASQWALAAAWRSLFVSDLGLGLRLVAWRGRCLLGRKNAAWASRILYFVAWGRFVTLVGGGDQQGGIRGGRHGVQTAVVDLEGLVARVGVSNRQAFLS